MLRYYFNNMPDYQRIFCISFIVTMLIKLTIALFFPITGDEAFFYQWGVHPALGYSDHPPMVGWMLAILNVFGDNAIILRSVTICVSHITALLVLDGLLKLLGNDRAEQAWLGATIYLILPWSWLPMLVTTDTPLMLFMALAGWAYIKANQEKQLYYVWYLAAGVFLALAFLSKYFAVLLGLAFAVHLLVNKKNKISAIFLLILPCIPAISIHLYFNATHGWPNIMFNLINRNADAIWSIKTPVNYILMLIYLVTPWLFYYSIKNIRKINLSTYLFAIPFVVFFFLSLKKTIGLHWVLGFIPYNIMWSAMVIDSQKLKRIIRWTIVYSALHLLLIAIFIWGPATIVKNTQWYGKLIFLRSGAEVANGIQPYNNAILMATAYTPASLMSYHLGRYVPVFGVGKFHSRQDDQLVNFQNYRSKDIRIYHGEQPPELSNYQPYFSKVSIESIEIAGVKFYFLDGQDFQYEVYRQNILQVIADKYYKFPDWLPIVANPFCERYNFSRCSAKK